MRASWPWLMAALLPSGTAPAFAQAAATGDTAPPGAFTLTGAATLTSDYRFRGLSRSDRRPAAQATVGVDHLSGFYAGAWASTVHGYAASGAGGEVDLYGGYRRTMGGTTLDGGLRYYAFPGGRGATDYFEPYLSASRSFGPLTARAGGDFAWSQRGLGGGARAGDRAAGAYGYAELSAGVPTTGLTLSAHAGHSFVRDRATFDTRYSDWRLTAAYSLRIVTLSLAYVDTDRRIDSHPLGGGPDRNIAGAGVVGAIGLSF